VSFSSTLDGDARVPSFGTHPSRLRIKTSLCLQRPNQLHGEGRDGATLCNRLPWSSRYYDRVNWVICGDIMFTQWSSPRLRATEAPSGSKLWKQMLDVHLLAIFKPQRKRLAINFFKEYLSMLLPGITFDTLVSTMPEQSSTPSVPRSFNGINHLKLPAQSLTKTTDFYMRIFPFTALPQYDHFTPDHRLFACMFTHAPTGLLVEVRYAPEQARAQRGWDPITWDVSKRADLEAWGAWLDANAVPRSRTFTGCQGLGRRRGARVDRSSRQG
jgi:hypothetical protein